MKLILVTDNAEVGLLAPELLQLVSLPEGAAVGITGDDQKFYPLAFFKDVRVTIPAASPEAPASEPTENTKQ